MLRSMTENGSVRESEKELGKMADLQVGEGHENGEEEPPTSWLS
jgi:hypothetical protein